jgi:transposase-like protein
MLNGYMSEDYLTSREIAERLGVSANTIRQWRYTRTYLEFPEPDLKGHGPGDTPYWSWKTIEVWAKKFRPELL